ncbi:MAG: peptide deformylase [Microthrixaceae bacterium]
MAYSIRIVGDPVLRRVAPEVTDIDGAFVQVVDEMFEAMYAAPGLGLAAPQVGIEQRFFVYDLGTDVPDRRVLVNPVITGSDGEWYYDEGCLSVPGQYFEIMRPKRIEVTGRDLDGNEVSFEADDLLARLIQHELDHLNGVLLLDLIDPEDARAARKAVREARLAEADLGDPRGWSISSGASASVAGEFGPRLVRVRASSRSGRQRPRVGSVRIAFLGTPEVAVTPLEALVEAGHEVAVVVTAPDRRRGRGGRTSPTPVKAAAKGLHLRVDESLDPLLASLRAASAVRPASGGAAPFDLGVVVAYGHLLPADLLGRLAFVNLHFSLLPRWRGAAPVERAILEGDERTGVCLMAVTEELGAGGVYRRAETTVGDKTLTDLWAELSRTGAALLVEWLAGLDAGALAAGGLPPAEPQVGRSPTRGS